MLQRTALLLFVLAYLAKLLDNAYGEEHMISVRLKAISLTQDVLSALIRGDGSFN